MSSESDSANGELPKRAEEFADRLACDRCGDKDASRVFNSDYNRLCDDCIDYENRENPECPDCGRRMLPDGPEEWECPDCWQSLRPEGHSMP